MCVKNSVLFKGRKIADVINIWKSSVGKKVSAIYELSTVYGQVCTFQNANQIMK